MSEPIQQAAKAAGDAISVATVIATIVGYLPAIAALVTIVWTCIRIYETETVQRLTRRKR